jgi:signal transduction histidine kinase/CheY-like chemotaxis protein/HPt (histidine-containing phosphotransfer) domain-containing protein
MKKIIPIEFNVLIGILIIIGIVGANGILAYRSLSGILNSINRAEQPDAKLILLKEIAYDLSEAEGNVKSFIVSRDSAYFSPIYAMETSINKKLDSLYKINDKIKSKKGLVNNNDKEIVDNILNLVKDKFYILNELMILKDDPATMKSRTPELTEKEWKVNSELRLLIARMEATERNLIALKTADADRMSNKAKTLIAVFCVTASILLLIMAFVTIRYIRTNKAYNTALKKAKSHADYLVKAKENFLANMSHEIRTPLNAILGFTEQALQSQLDKEQRQQLVIVKKSADHLMDVVNDILDFSKLEAGKLELEMIGFKPKDIIYEVTQLMSIFIDSKKGVSINYVIEKNTPEVLIGDPVRLKQMLLNIAGNAVKFTEKGSITIKASSRVIMHKEIILSISVSDTGIGIQKDKLDRIFNAFEQGDSSTTRKFGGSGLGLSITKRLVDLHHGAIDIKSNEDKGTTVTIALPYLVGTAGDIQKKIETFNQNGVLAHCSILIADDEEYNRKLLSTILKKWEVNFEEAKNGQEVLDQMKKNDFDLILLDALMPVMSGIEAAHKIRLNKDYKKSHIPIIGLSAATGQEDIKKCINAGMNDFLTKPFKEKDLHDKIVNALKLPKEKKNGFHHEEKKTSKNIKPQSKFNTGKYNLDELYRIGEGNEEFVLEMVRVFIRTTNEGLKIIKEHTAMQEWDKVADQYHKIAAPCLHLGAEELYSMIKIAEFDSRNKTKLEDLPGLLERIEKEAATLITFLQKEIINKNFPVSL